ncbi:MAG TPA: S8 family serine peptidase [Polyangiaceae bacterium]|nr:S8 family serine peptidase [Polyangiaceae bacterium]
MGLLALSLAAACGDDDDNGGQPVVARPAEGEPVAVPFECPEAAAAEGEHVVLVIDNGFDLSLPELEGKVIGCYQRVCDGPSPGAGGPPPADFAEAKRRFLEELGQKDVSCRLAKGASLRKSSSFERIAPQKDAWNRALASKTLSQEFPGFEEVARVLGGERSFVYHGTWVLSALAHQNPKAKFVVVNNEAIRRSDARPGCPSAEDFERELALLRDPEVRAAYLASPYEQLGEQTDELVRRFGVTVVNRSFGFDPWPLMAEACPGLDWQGYYALQAELSNARTAALSDAGAFGGMSVLSLDAAGNDGYPLESAADSLNCGGGGQPDGFGPASASLLVGSYDPATLARSEFSNYGRCVDAYAPGEAIVVTGPDGWLNVVSGTSFAAPLAARAVTLEQPAGAGGLALRDGLFAARGPEGNLPKASFPAALFYRDAAPPGAGTAALASLVARAAPPPALAAGGPLRAPRRPSFAPELPSPRRRGGFETDAPLAPAAGPAGTSAGHYEPGATTLPNLARPPRRANAAQGAGVGRRLRGPNRTWSSSPATRCRPQGPPSATPSGPSSVRSGRPSDARVASSARRPLVALGPRGKVRRAAGVRPPLFVRPARADADGVGVLGADLDVDAHDRVAAHLGTPLAQRPQHPVARRLVARAERLHEPDPVVGRGGRRAFEVQRDRRAGGGAGRFGGRARGAATTGAEGEGHEGGRKAEAIFHHGSNGNHGSRSDVFAGAAFALWSVAEGPSEVRSSGERSSALPRSSTFMVSAFTA